MARVRGRKRVRCPRCKSADVSRFRARAQFIMWLASKLTLQRLSCRACGVRPRCEIYLLTSMTWVASRGFKTGHFRSFWILHLVLALLTMSLLAVALSAQNQNNQQPYSREQQEVLAVDDAIQADGRAFDSRAYLTRVYLKREGRWRMVQQQGTYIDRKQ